MSEPTPAQRHREIAGGFSARVAGAASESWDDPSPVADWRARDVVRHLVGWSAGFIEAGAGIVLPAVASVDDDPVAAWHGHVDRIQALLDDPGDRVLSDPHIGEVPLADAIDRFYTTDVFMHTWDLAQATGQDHGLDPAACAALLDEMEPLDEMLRASGQYGAPVDVPADADPVDRLMAFVGRDPHWRLTLS